MKLTVIVTVYNEKDTILRAVEDALSLKIDKEIIVVDNCSTDGTVDILKSIKEPNIKIIYQPENYGYGVSVLTGLNMAKGEYIYIQHSDLEYDISCVYEMLGLAEKENLDVILGSRLMSRKDESKFKIFRERPWYLGTFITTFLVNLLFGKQFIDIIGNRFFRTRALKAMDMKSLKSGFDFEIASKAVKAKLGLKVREIPVAYKPRTSGKKVRLIDIFPAVWTIFKVRFSLI